MMSNKSASVIKKQDTQLTIVKIVPTRQKM